MTEEKFSEDEMRARLEELEKAAVADFPGLCGGITAEEQGGTQRASML